jgi:hypothetical protein
MKNLCFLFAFISLFCVTKAFGQTNNSEVVAMRMAKKMQDTLNLNQNELVNVYDINMVLNTQKTQARQSTTHPDSLRKKIQVVANFVSNDVCRFVTCKWLAI